MEPKAVMGKIIVSDSTWKSTFRQADKAPYSYLRSQNLMYEFSLIGQTVKGMGCISSVLIFL